jgi:Transglycosylase SLT domain
MRPGLPVAVACIALTVLGTAGGGTAAVLTGVVGARQPVKKTAGTPSRAMSVTNVVPTSVQPAAMKGVVPPDFLAIGSSTVDKDELGKISKLKGVQDVITADAGSVQLQGGKVNMFAVDPAQFRSWTPPGTASDDNLWASLAHGQFVVSDDVQTQMGLRTGLQYSISGRTTSTVTMGGSGSLGLPGIDVLVGRDAGQRIGLVPDLAVLVNAPGVDLKKLQSRIQTVLGGQSQVLNLHKKQNQPKQQQAPVAQESTSSGRPSTYLELYKWAAQKWCPGLSWTVLAAIGQVESDHGRNDGPSSAGAMGPMQFMPATWQTYGVDGDGDGKADIMNPYDAIPAAAHYLCVMGAGQGPSHVSRAVFGYNHSQQYVNMVVSLANAYAKEYN